MYNIFYALEEEKINKHSSIGKMNLPTFKQMND